MKKLLCPVSPSWVMARVAVPSCFSDGHPSHTLERSQGSSCGDGAEKDQASFLLAWAPPLSASMWWVSRQGLAVQLRTRLCGSPEKPTVQVNRTTEVRRLLSTPAPVSHRIGPDTSEAIYLWGSASKGNSVGPSWPLSRV